MLRFTFGGSHIATLPTLEPSGFTFGRKWGHPSNFNRSGSAGRTKSADFTLLRDPVTGKHSAFLVVEFKQYKEAPKGNFMAALIDYAHGRPDADIVLFNYGPAPALWIEEAPLELRERLPLIGDFRPGSKYPPIHFRQIIQQAISLRTLPSLGVLSQVH